MSSCFRWLGLLRKRVQAIYRCILTGNSQFSAVCSTLIFGSHVDSSLSTTDKQRFLTVQKRFRALLKKIWMLLQYSFTYFWMTKAVSFESFCEKKFVYWKRAWPFRTEIPASWRKTTPLIVPCPQMRILMACNSQQRAQKAKRHTLMEILLWIYICHHHEWIEKTNNEIMKDQMIGNVYNYKNAWLLEKEWKDENGHFRKALRQEDARRTRTILLTAMFKGMCKNSKKTNSTLGPML